MCTAAGPPGQVERSGNFWCKIALRYRQTCSIGLRSGEQGGWSATFHKYCFLLAGGAGVAIVSCKSDGRGTTSTDDILLATIDVCCKSLDTAGSSNPSPPSIIGSARCMSYNMSYDMSYPEHLALHNMQGGGRKYFRPRTVCSFI